MGSLAPELSLDLKLFVEKCVVGFLKDRMSAEDLFSRLKEEQRKIEAFKRELPLCMLLLNDVIGGLKMELEQKRGGGYVLEEFISLKSRSDEDGRRGQMKMEKESKEKMEWMSSAQLWSDKCSDESIGCEKDSHENRRDGGNDGRRNNDSLSPESWSRSSSGGAFVPFKAMPAPGKEDEKLRNSLPDLSLVSPAMKVSSFAPTAADTTEDDNGISGLGSKAAVSALTPAASSATSCHQGLQLQQQFQHQLPRKMRRCWSPELHRRFVISLQQLGGPQVATPKQIRELMKVDGLTNDEVKSHLQKYRLHTRRMPNSSGSTQVKSPVVLVGGLWLTEDHSSASQQQSGSQSGSPQGPLQLACSAQALSAIDGDSCNNDRKSESYGWK